MADDFGQNKEKTLSWLDRAARVMGSAVGAAFVLTKPVVEKGTAFLSEFGQAFAKQRNPAPPPKGKSVQINELSRELDVWAEDIFDFLLQVGVTEKLTNASYLDVSMAKEVREHFRTVEARQVSVNEHAPKRMPEPQVLFRPPSNLSTSVKPPAATNSTRISSEKTATSSLFSPTPARQLSEPDSRNQDLQKSKTKRRVKEKDDEFRRSFKKLDFDPKALEKFIALDHQRGLAVLDQFERLNSGVIDDKHHVPRTNPKLFQRDAGPDVRIYYRQHGTARRILIRLIGTKKDQDSDYAAMQSRS